MPVPELALVATHLVLSPNVPHREADVLVHDFVHVESCNE